MRLLLRLASAGVMLAGSLLLVPAIAAHTLTASLPAPDPAAAERAPLAAVIGAALAECEAGDCYGAIATSNSTHHWGYVYNESSRAAAEAEALAQCGGGDCEVRVWFANSCGAVASGADEVAWGHADTREGAEAEAMAACKAAGCHIETWACTSRA
jgi:uncharacterized protein DUF4189